MLLCLDAFLVFFPRCLFDFWYSCEVNQKNLDLSLSSRSLLLKYLVLAKSISVCSLGFGGFIDSLIWFASIVLISFRSRTDREEFSLFAIRKGVKPELCEFTSLSFKLLTV